MSARARGLDEVTGHLAKLLGDAPREPLHVRPLVTAPAPARVLAVDGSSVTLAESGSHALVAYRAGRIQLDGGRPLAAPPQPVDVRLLADGDVAPLRDALAALGLDAAPLPARPAAKATLDALRTLQEHAIALVALEGAPAGSLLLLDGALQARASAPLMDRLVERARARGIDLVGVCKSTSMTVGGAPALSAARLAARPLGATPWTVELPAPPAVRGRVILARLSAAEARPFRFDVLARDEDPLRVVAALASLAGHPAYPGYPSPLAMAHNAALIAEPERLRLLADVREAVLAAGVREHDWDAAFLDYHDVLELGA